MQDELLEAFRINTNDNTHFSCFFRFRFYSDMGSFACTISSLKIAKKSIDSNTCHSNEIH